MKKKILITVCSVFLITLAFGSFPAFAGSTSEICTELSGNNIGVNDYGRYADPVYSYLIDIGSGFMRVQGYAGTSDDPHVDIIYYDEDFNAVSCKQIEQELPLFGAFAQTDSSYFIISGQENPDESDDCEVVRITKYDKSWNRIGSCGLFGANTYCPFHAGSCRAAAVGDNLAINTCHTMYEASDGLHHQANMIIEVDTSEMQIIYSNYRVGGSGYVSHSFNQFIVAGDGKAAILDHGDAYPRGIIITDFESDQTEGTILSTVTGSGAVEYFPGDTGDNDTGATLGGFERSSQGYLVAGSSIYQYDSETMDLTRPMNAFVSIADPDEKTVATNWLTDVSDGVGTPQMVKISDDCFVVLWSHGKYIEYTAVDGGARSISGVYSAQGELSDCKPIVSDGKILWYTYGNVEMQKMRGREDSGISDSFHAGV